MEVGLFFPRVRLQVQERPRGLVCAGGESVSGEKNPRQRPGGYSRLGKEDGKLLPWSRGTATGSIRQMAVSQRADEGVTQLVTDRDTIREEEKDPWAGEDRGR